MFSAYFSPKESKNLKNYKLSVKYDGTDYSGWQVQSNAVSVQQTIIRAIHTITKSDINLIGAGRTDSGVHAIGQIANFRYDEELDLYRFRYQLNSLLPADIAVTRIEEVPVEFHSRYDAKKRSYIYIITNNKNPFLKKYSWFINKQLDIERLNQLSRLLQGRKDFTAFCKSSAETQNKQCEVYNISWRRLKSMIIFYIEADRFLHGMVRTIVGTLLRAVDQISADEYIHNILRKNNRIDAGESVPASGLFLYKVKYEDKL
jgi:tRNA pseudouridine38-40 synthase